MQEFNSGNAVQVAANGEVVSPSQLNRYKKELAYFDRLHAEKYRDTGQSKYQHCEQMADRLASDYTHKTCLQNIFWNNRFLPAGRVQAAYGATEREVSPFNCSVSQQISDNIDSIMSAQSNAVKILRLGTGIGYNFSHLRPKGAEIQKLKTEASGPLSFMEGFDIYAKNIASAGHRRGAQMAILNISHPDIEEFIDAKIGGGKYRQFNLSVGVTHSFMSALEKGESWKLIFDGKVYKEIPAAYLWDKMIRNAYKCGDPGIVLLDRFNEQNNLYYCEHIEATNPCSEQPLPPYGLCTLGSFNLAAYLFKNAEGKIRFNSDCFISDIYQIVEAYDNIFDDAIYAIPEHREEAVSKRRIGLGLTGIANALELMIGRPSYGDKEFCTQLNTICETLMVVAYRASIDLAKKRGSFALFDKDKYLNSNFIIDRLPDWLTRDIYSYGIRNSHLISYAPCGTISQIAWNVSSGVEPVFYHEISRDVYMRDGKENITISDFAWREYGFKGKTQEECTVEDHLKVGEICQKFCDSAVSKTINVPASYSFEEYKNVYTEAYRRGFKGITIFRPNDISGVVIKKADVSTEETSDIEEWKQLELPLDYSDSSAVRCASGVCER